VWVIRKAHRIYAKKRKFFQRAEGKKKVLSYAFLHFVFLTLSLLSSDLKEQGKQGRQG